LECETGSALVFGETTAAVARCGYDTLPPPDCAFCRLLAFAFSLPRLRFHHFRWNESSNLSKREEKQNLQKFYYIIDRLKS
jgi:hypothetical protein